MRYSLVLFMLLAVSCGQVVQEPRIKMTESYEEESTGEPFILKYDSRECTEEDSYLFKYFTENSTYKNIEYIPLNNSTAGTFNISKNTLLKKEMLFGGKVINRLTLNTRTNQITSTRVVAKKADRRELCIGKDYTDSNTLDAVGVKVEATMTMVEAAVKKTSLPRSLRPITIRIHPEYINEEVIASPTRKKTSAKSLINNALFNYEHQEMVILAQGTNLNGIVPFSGVTLWDIPVVTAHEYGHYVFSKLYPNYFDSVAPYKISRAHLCYDNHTDLPFGAAPIPHDPTDPEKQNDKEKEDTDENDEQVVESPEFKTTFDFKPVNNTDKNESDNSRSGRSMQEVKPTESNFDRTISEHTFIGALNEGFADLFARYTLDDEYTVNGVGCLSFTRDVYSSSFLNGERKILSKKIIDSFNSSIKHKRRSCFTHTDTQSLHVIGAVLAHGVDKVYSAVGLDKTQKLKELVKWAKSINRSHNFIMQLAYVDILNYYAYTAFKNLMEEYLEHQVQIKAIFEENFPEAAKEYSL